MADNLDLAISRGIKAYSFLSSSVDSYVSIVLAQSKEAASDTVKTKFSNLKKEVSSRLLDLYSLSQVISSKNIKRTFNLATNSYKNFEAYALRIFPNNNVKTKNEKLLKDFENEYNTVVKILNSPKANAKPAPPVIASPSPSPSSVTPALQPPVGSGDDDTLVQKLGGDGKKYDIRKGYIRLITADSKINLGNLTTEESSYYSVSEGNQEDAWFRAFDNPKDVDTFGAYTLLRKRLLKSDTAAKSSNIKEKEKGSPTEKTKEVATTGYDLTTLNALNKDKDPSTWNTTKAVTSAPKEICKVDTPDQSKWGVRFSHSNCDSFFFSLLPAYSSTLKTQGGLDVPNAQPGLSFSVKPNIAKMRIPGSGPVFQHLGVDTVMVTMVGRFSGIDGPKESIEEKLKPRSANSNDIFNRNKVVIDSLSDKSNKDTLLDFDRFYKFSFLQGKELEVEINLSKYFSRKVDRKQIKELDDSYQGIRDFDTGNIKFKAHLRQIETYHARSNATYYTIQLEISDFGLVSKVPVPYSFELQNIKALPSNGSTSSNTAFGGSPLDQFAEEWRDSSEYPRSKDAWKTKDGVNIAEVTYCPNGLLNALPNALGFRESDKLPLVNLSLGGCRSIHGKLNPATGKYYKISNEEFNKLRKNADAIRAKVGNATVGDLFQIVTDFVLCGSGAVASVATGAAGVVASFFTGGGAAPVALLFSGIMVGGTILQCLNALGNLLTELFNTDIGWYEKEDLTTEEGIRFALVGAFLEALGFGVAKWSGSIANAVWRGIPLGTLKSIKKSAEYFLKNRLKNPEGLTKLIQSLDENISIIEGKAPLFSKTLKPSGGPEVPPAAGSSKVSVSPGATAAELEKSLKASLKVGDDIKIRDINTGDEVEGVLESIENGLVSIRKANGDLEKVPTKFVDLDNITKLKPSLNSTYLERLQKDSSEIVITLKGQKTSIRAKIVDVGTDEIRIYDLDAPRSITTDTNGNPIYNAKGNLIYSDVPVEVPISKKLIDTIDEVTVNPPVTRSTGNPTPTNPLTSKLINDLNANQVNKEVIVSYKVSGKATTSKGIYKGQNADGDLLLETSGGPVKIPTSSFTSFKEVPPVATTVKPSKPKSSPAPKVSEYTPEEWAYVLKNDEYFEEEVIIRTLKNKKITGIIDSISGDTVAIRKIQPNGTFQFEFVPLKDIYIVDTVIPLSKPISSVSTASSTTSTATATLKQIKGATGVLDPTGTKVILKNYSNGTAVNPGDELELLINGEVTGSLDANNISVAFWDKFAKRSGVSIRKKVAPTSPKPPDKIPDTPPPVTETPPTSGGGSVARASNFSDAEFLAEVQKFGIGSKITLKDIGGNIEPTEVIEIGNLGIKTKDVSDGFPRTIHYRDLTELPKKVELTSSPVTPRPGNIGSLTQEVINAYNKGPAELQALVNSGKLEPIKVITGNGTLNLAAKTTLESVTSVSNMQEANYLKYTINGKIYLIPNQLNSVYFQKFVYQIKQDSAFSKGIGDTLTQPLTLGNDGTSFFIDRIMEWK